MDSASGLNSEWAAIVTALNNDRVEVVPPGWKTAKQLVGMLGNNGRTVRERLTAAVAHQPPLVEVRKFRVKLNQRVYPVPHYRLLKPRPKARG